MKGTLILILATVSNIATVTVTATGVYPVYIQPVTGSDMVGIIHMDGTGDWYRGTNLVYSVQQIGTEFGTSTPIYKYDYSFIEYGTDANDGMNAMLLEFSMSCDNDPGCYRDDPRPYAAGEVAHLPVGFNAAEFDADNTDNRGLYGFHFLSNRSPVWGNFFAVGDGFNAWSYNMGLVNLMSANKSDFIPRPDGDGTGTGVDNGSGDVPEPDTFWALWIIGVGAVGVWWWRRFKGRGRTWRRPLGGGNSYSGRDDDKGQGD